MDERVVKDQRLDEDKLYVILKKMVADNTIQLLSEVNKQPCVSKYYDEDAFLRNSEHVQKLGIVLSVINNNVTFTIENTTKIPDAKFNL